MMSQIVQIGFTLLSDFVPHWCFKVLGAVPFEYIILAHFPVALITLF